MKTRGTRRTLLRGIALMASLAVLAALSVAQEPVTGTSEPVKKGLEDLKRQMASKAPAERLKAYAEGVELLKKSGVVEKALNVGDKAPDFALPNASGMLVRLSSLLKNGPVVMTWYRGAWCPYCNIALHGFQKVLPEIKAEGASLAAISPQTPDNSLSTVEKAGLSFEVLSDQGNKAARAYGVVYKVPAVVLAQSKGRIDLSKYNGDSSNELPLAATYVIDRQGVIRYAFVDADYRKRAEPSTIVAALRGLKKTR